MRDQNALGRPASCPGRNSAHSRVDYDRADGLFKMAYFAPNEFPREWEEWRTVSDRYKIDRRRAWPLLAAAVSQLISDGVRSPFELAALEAAAVEPLMASFDNRFVGRDFWRADRPNSATASSSDPLFLVPYDVDNSVFRRAIKRRQEEI